MEKLRIQLRLLSELAAIGLTAAAAVLNIAAWGWSGVMTQHRISLLGILIGAVFALAHLYKR